MAMLIVPFLCQKFDDSFMANVCADSLIFNLSAYWTFQRYESFGIKRWWISWLFTRNSNKKKDPMPKYNWAIFYGQSVFTTSCFLLLLLWYRSMCRHWQWCGPSVWIHASIKISKKVNCKRTFRPTTSFGI